MWAEWLSAVGIFVSLVLCSIVPYCLLSSGNSHRKHGNSLVLSLCNCIACGIFLSTCFLGLIPHVRHHEGLIREKLYANDTEKMNMSVPAPAAASGAGHGHHHSEGPAWLNTEVVVLAGFVLILLIEQAMMSCSSGSGHSHSSHSGHSHLASEPHAAHTSIARARLLDLGEEEAEQPLVMTEFGDDDDDDMDAIVFRKEGSDEPEAHHSHGGGSGGHSHIIPLDEGLSPRSVLLLLGLGIHSVFEGVALGLQKDGGDFVKIMFAIMLHEVLCCVAFGVSLAQQRAPRAAAAASVAILAACIPAGMVAAFMVDALDSSHSLVLRFALEGLAAGTFVYVSCVEMLSAELQEGHGRGGVVKALSVGAGVLLFWVLQNAFKH